MIKVGKMSEQYTDLIEFISVNLKEIVVAIYSEEQLTNAITLLICRKKWIGWILIVPNSQTTNMSVTAWQVKRGYPCSHVVEVQCHKQDLIYTIETLTGSKNKVGDKDIII